ncbi:hypothetical protein SAMN05216567_12852 [Variovorax sp. OK605]|uniref:hypothetical protein n=1 Tax=Variovorax sp. OK605 TaxID=1855317 RepID=UPI0008EF6EA6|nr:hypothetical protein [Variovorax sp. OK605]SFQ70857.1 hypothetical protein SAMN05216567_12852 [Variovorax sp. OK605]
MSQADFFPSPSPSDATILSTPVWYSDKARNERELPLTPGDYKITPGDRWTVASLKTGEVVYDGIGPVEILRKRAEA